MQTLTRSDRRGFLRVGVGGAMGLMLGQWLQTAQAGGVKSKTKSVILLWMNGGPSHLDTFDPKPGRRNGGPVRALKTSAPGLELSEYLPQLAEHGKHLAVIRSLTSREGNHDRGQFVMHTGFIPAGPVTHPSFGAVVSKENEEVESDLPQFVTINGPSVGAGFLGTNHNPVVVRDPRRPVDHIAYAPDVNRNRFNLRMQFLNVFEDELKQQTPSEVVKAHEQVKLKALRLMHSPMLKAFDVANEPTSVRAAYGNSPFGQGVLMARRLAEVGVKFVEVYLDGWDTHSNNFTATRNLCSQLDPAFATLLRELSERDRLRDTLVVWMGEFGRTPRINPNEGRDHWPQSSCVALAGAGVKGGTIIGSTGPEGEETLEPVSVPDLFASLCHGIGLRADRAFYTPDGRPIRVTDNGKVLRQLFAA